MFRIVTVSQYTVSHITSSACLRNVPISVSIYIFVLYVFYAGAIIYLHYVLYRPEARHDVAVIVAAYFHLEAS